MIGAWILLGITFMITVGFLFYMRRVWPQRLHILKDAMTTELELADHLRLIMDDLESRDPQLTEHMQLGKIEVDRLKKELERSLTAIEMLRKSGIG